MDKKINLEHTIRVVVAESLGSGVTTDKYTRTGNSFFKSVHIEPKKGDEHVPLNGAVRTGRNVNKERSSETMKEEEQIDEDDPTTYLDRFGAAYSGTLWDTGLYRGGSWGAAKGAVKKPKPAEPVKTPTYVPSSPNVPQRGPTRRETPAPGPRGPGRYVPGPAKPSGPPTRKPSEKKPDDKPVEAPKPEAPSAPKPEAPSAPKPAEKPTVTPPAPKPVETVPAPKPVETAPAPKRVDKPANTPTLPEPQKLPAGQPAETPAKPVSIPDKGRPAPAINPFTKPVSIPDKGRPAPAINPFTKPVAPAAVPAPASAPAPVGNPAANPLYAPALQQAASASTSTAAATAAAAAAATAAASRFGDRGGRHNRGGGRRRGGFPFGLPGGGTFDVPAGGSGKTTDVTTYTHRAGKRLADRFAEEYNLQDAEEIKRKSRKAQIIRKIIDEQKKKKRDTSTVDLHPKLKNQEPDQN